MRILLVEDSPRMQKSICIGLKRQGYTVDVCADGEDGLFRATSINYDAIILDWMLPKMDGVTMLKKLREQGIRTHVLILSARDLVADRVNGLDSGADDYLVKPFEFEELLARLNALIRRAYGVKSSLIQIGDFLLDMTSRTLRRADEPISLTPREYSLLELLMLKSGQTVSRTEIEKCIYDELAEPMSNVVDATVYALRRKIDVPGQPSLIRTRRKWGYMIESPGMPPIDDSDDSFYEESAPCM